MPEKGKGKVFLRMDTGKAIPYPFYHRIQVVRATIGKLLSADISPNALHRIYVGRVCRKANYTEPFPLLFQILTHQAAAVRW